MKPKVLDKNMIHVRTKAKPKASKIYLLKRDMNVICINILAKLLEFI